MTSQQLIEARAALWHHNAEPILTLDDAASWVAANGFLLFLPRHQQLRAPSPTFVEACMGKLEHTPARADIENALSLAHRLFESGEVFPLNLLGTLSEEPDFLIARDRLPWLLSLRGDRSWKTAPGGRTSPLNISIWNLLDEQGELSAEEIRAGVGREVTDASIRRALVDLWGTLRVFPRYHDGDTTWALAKTLCPKECTKGVTTSQGAALSFFLADYLRSAIAAAEDEIASFLSPLASRSRLREVLHALVATRQLLTIQLGPNALYYVAGELPEFPEIAVPEAVSEAAASSSGEPGSMPEDATDGERESHERIRKYAPRAESHESFQRRDRPSGDYRRSASDRPAARGGFKPRSEGDFKPRREGGFKPREEGGFRPRREGEFKPRRSEGGYSRPSRDDRESRPPRREGGFRPREEGGFKPRREGGFKPRGEGDFKPRREGGFKPRSESGFRPPFRKPRPESESGLPESNRPERTSAGEGRPPFRKSGFGDRERKPFARKFQGDGERKSYGERKPYGDRKSFGERKPFGDRKRSDFGSREDRPREDRPRAERSGARPDFRPDFRKERSGDDRPRRDSASSDRPPRKSFGKPGGFAKSGGKSFGKSSFKSSGTPSGERGKKTFGKGPGKPAGKSGFGKGPGKSFGKKFSKGPGKGPAKGSFRGAGKPRRRPE